MASPSLPLGDDERFTGYGVMGLPFSSGHYLAFRCWPRTSIGPGYRAVWHRDPGGRWTLYATEPPQRSCARYLSAATTSEPVTCPVEAHDPARHHPLPASPGASVADQAVIRGEQAR